MARSRTLERRAPLGRTPGTIQAIQLLRSSDTQIRFIANQDGGMSWGNGSATQDVSLVRSAAGVLQVDGPSGGAISDNVAWVSVSPQIASSGGSLTTASCTMRWNAIGKRIFFSLKATITTNGTGSGSIVIGGGGTLPFTPNAAYVQVAYGRADGVSGKQLQGKFNGSTLTIFNYDGTYPGASGEILIMNGVIESA